MPRRGGRLCSPLSSSPSKMKFFLVWLIAAAATLVIFADAASPSSGQNAATSTSTYLTESDKIRLKKVIEPGFALDNPAATYFAVIGYKLLEEKIPNIPEICKYVIGLLEGKDRIEETPENLFYIVSTWKTLGSCPNLPSAALTTALTQIVTKETSTIPDIYHGLAAYTALSKKFPDSTVNKLIKTVQTALKKDDSLSNLGYTFHIGSLLGPAGSFALEKIEDAIVQADEVDGRFLQFEGGLSVTSLVIDGIAKLSSSLKKPPPVSSSQIVKLSSYLLSRRSVQTPKGVIKLLSALKTLAENEFEKPICITIADGGLIISAQKPLLKIRVSDIFGRELTKVPNVVANSATRVGDDVVVVSKKRLEVAKDDKTLFTMNLMSIKPQRGFYKISVSAGSVSNEVTVKVLSEVQVNYLEIGTGDADQTTQPKLLKVSYPEKLADRVEADSQQKLVIRFLLRDSASGTPMRVHQAFVRLQKADAELLSEEDRREVVFVAEPDAAHVYKFDMPVNSAAQTFGHESGDYNVVLVVGDAILSNPFEWTLARVALKFPEPPNSSDLQAANDKSAAYKQKPNVYSMKPEIKHMFREPEKRPPVFVSNLFTGLCLAPVLLLLILWAKLQVNIAKFPFSLSAIVFHLGLGSIFVLFGIFWLKLDMFVTLRYLLGLGIVTFLAGSKLLSEIAHGQKSSR